LSSKNEWFFLDLFIAIILTTRLQNAQAKVDFAIPSGQGHGGDYDLDELFDWIDMICNP